jgi:DNA polymerase III gamma/tau subunit
MLETLAQKDTKRGLLICKELVMQGMDFKFFIEQLMDRLHLMLLQEVGVEKKEKQIPFSLLEIEKLFAILTAAYQETKTAVLAQMPLELAILEWGNTGLALKSPFEFDESSNASAPAKLGVRSPAETLVKTSSHQNAPRAFDNNGNSGNLVSSPQSSSFFGKLIDEVKLQNHLIAGVLRGCSAEETQDGKLNIIARSKFHKEKLDEVKTRQLLEECADKISGKKLNIQITLQGVIDK